jgi:protein-S-isoprenylcysteine O-methyltransferase Ste14
MLVVAIALVAANWFLLLGGLLTFTLLVIRTRREEERLADRFGDVYRAYMANTGRFLPKIG